MTIRNALSVSVVLVASCAYAVNPHAQAVRTSILIRAAHVLDVKSGMVLEDQSIVVQDGRITSIGPSARMTGPADARHVDLPHATVLPGLIDVHTHLTREIFERLRTPLISVPREALIGVRTARATLEAGFTTVRNLSAVGYSDVALRDAIEAGDVVGPRMLVSGPPLTITGGQCDTNSLPPEFRASSLGAADGIAAVQHAVREIVKYGADVIKVCATGAALGSGVSAQQSQYSLEELRAIVADAHRLGRKVAVHAHGAEAIRWAVDAGADSIEHGTFIDDAGIAAMKAHGSYLVPTTFVAEWTSTAPDLPAAIAARSRVVMEAEHQHVGRAIAAGVTVAFGTDSGVYPHGMNAKQFAALVKLGLPPLRAIQAATITAADLLGWQGRIGTLEPGAWADVIAVDGNPVQDVTTLEQVKFVMKSGVVIKNGYATQ